jgi:hypothetical protein
MEGWWPIYSIFRIPRSMRTKGFGILLDAVQVVQDRFENKVFTFMVVLRPLEVAQERMKIVHTPEDEKNILDIDAGKFRLAFHLDKIDQAIDPGGLVLSIAFGSHDDIPPLVLEYLFSRFFHGFTNWPAVQLLAMYAYRAEVTAPQLIRFFNDGRKVVT